jgi:hypothetical protein
MLARRRRRCWRTCGAASCRARCWLREARQALAADLVVALGLGGDCLADVAVLRAQPELCGPWPGTSDLPAGRALAADAPRAIRKARAAARERARGWPGTPGRLARRDAGVVRKERPHPGAQLRFTDTGGHRLTCFATNAKTGQLADLELRHHRRAGLR